MARIAGIDIPNEKRVEYGLTYIYGIGHTSSMQILTRTGINPDTRCKDLTEAEVAQLREVIETEYVVEGDLRHRRNLPVRGQRTKTNARTRRGTRRTVAGKKRAAAKK